MSSTFAAFLIASTILAVTPGPGVIYVVTRTLSRGRQAGLASVGGIALGNLANATAASLGLAALLAASATAFAVMKLAGAAYLVFLGVKSLKPKPVIEVPRATDRVSNCAFVRRRFFRRLAQSKNRLVLCRAAAAVHQSGRATACSELGFGLHLRSHRPVHGHDYVLAAAALAPRIHRHIGIAIGGPLPDRSDIHRAWRVCRDGGPASHTYMSTYMHQLFEQVSMSHVRLCCCSSGSSRMPSAASRPLTRRARRPARNTSAQSWAARCTRRSPRRTASPARAPARSSAW